MNFKLARFFSLTISFITGSFFFFIGIISLFLLWSPLFQKTAAEFILENPLILSLFGLGFALMGLSIIIYAFLSTRRRTLLIRTGNLAVTVDENVVRQTLESYWLEQFPESLVSFNLTIKKHAIQIQADLPFLPLEKQKIFLDQVKEDFTQLFGRQIGYPYDVQLIANFKTQQNKHPSLPDESF